MVRPSLRIRVVAAAALAASGCGPIELHPFFQARGAPVVFAHRGGGGVLPEATLAAMLRAESRDPEAVVEFDVHRSLDGHIVVIHDETVDRTTDGSGRVDALTLAQLQALDAGFCATPGVGDGTAPEGECQGAAPGAFPFRGAGHRIPTLAEALAALKPETAIGIEVKARGFEAQFAQAVRDSGRLERLVVGSAIDEVSVRLRDLLPEVAHYLPRDAATCFGLTAKARLDYAACPRYEVFASPLQGSGLALDTRDVLSAAHRDGVAVVYWTINAEDDLDRLFRLGADGAFTDYPDLARQVIDRLRAAGELP